MKVTKKTTIEDVTRALQLKQITDEQALKAIVKLAARMHPLERVALAAQIGQQLVTDATNPLRRKA